MRRQKKWQEIGKKGGPGEGILPCESAPVIAPLSAQLNLCPEGGSARDSVGATRRTGGKELGREDGHRAISSTVAMPLSAQFNLGRECENARGVEFATEAQRHREPPGAKLPEFLTTDRRG